MMSAWSELHLLQWRFPWGALVLLLPLALAWLARRQKQRLASYADAHLLPWAVLQTGPGLGLAVGGRWVFNMLAWLLLALAAAGPRLPALASDAHTNRSIPPHQIDLMVVLDVSASMAATDVAPDRFSRARLELTDLLQRHNGERLGLILYAGQAGVLLPPTDDAALFRQALGQAGADLIEAPGTDVAQALRLARQTLRSDAAPHRRAVLLVTDADTSSIDGTAAKAAREAVQALRADDIALFVLVVASAEGAPMSLAGGEQAMKDGIPVISRPDVRGYRRLAHDSGGEMAWVRDGDADWDALYDDGIARLPSAAVSAAAAQAWHELFGWPLGLALGLLLWLHLPPANKRALMQTGVLLAVLLGNIASMGMTPPAAAQDASSRSPPPATAVAQVTAQAAQAYRTAQWSQAQALFARQGGYAGHMGGGASAWKLRDYASAARHFSQGLLLARTDGERDAALYNLGNAYFGLAQWDRAAQAWRAVLLSRPGDAAAAANLGHAEAQLAKRSGVPMKSDLRGRRGFLSEGLVNVDGAVGAQDDSNHLPELPQGPRGASATDAAGARLTPQVDTAHASLVPLDPQRLQSGLVKLERLEERQRELLRGLLKQDRVPESSSASAGVPW